MSCLAAAASAQTRPLLTEEATTAPAGTLVFELGADAIADEPNFLTEEPRDRLDVPVLRLVYSPASNVELDLEWVGRVIAFDDPDFGTVSDFGDVSLRAKVRFAEGGGGRPAFGARFGVTLPQTSYGNGLGPNTLRFSTQLLLSQKVGGLTVHSERRPRHPRRGAAGARAEGLPRLRPRLRTRARRVARPRGRGGRPGRQRHARNGRALGGARGRALGNEALRFDAAVRRGLADADGTWGITAGLSWRLRDGG